MQNENIILGLAPYLVLLALCAIMCRGWVQVTCILAGLCIGSGLIALHMA